MSCDALSILYDDGINFWTLLTNFCAAYFASTFLPYKHIVDGGIALFSHESTKVKFSEHK